MKSLLRFLLIAIALVLVGLWIMTIAKSCNNSADSTISKVGDGIEEAGDKIFEGADAVSDGVNDLASDEEDEFDDAEFDDAEFDEDGDEVLSKDEDDFSEGDDEDADIEEEPASGSSSSGSSSASGNYLVVSGSFLGEENAKNEVSRLKKLGFNNAEIVEFDFSQYHSVCVKRTNSLSEARSIKNQLVNEHNIEAYVHKKRKGKRG